MARPKVSEELQRNSPPRRTALFALGARRRSRHSSAALRAPLVARSGLNPWRAAAGRRVHTITRPPCTSKDWLTCARSRRARSCAERQLFEELILVLDGRGSTTDGDDAGRRIAFEVEGTARCSQLRSIAGTSISTARPRAGQLCRGDQLPPPVINLMKKSSCVQQPATIQEPVRGEPDYFSANKASKGPASGHPFCVADEVNLPTLSGQGNAGAGGGNPTSNMARGP